MILNHHFRQVFAEEHISELRRELGARRRDPAVASGARGKSRAQQPHPQPQPIRLPHQDLTHAGAEQ